MKEQCGTPAYIAPEVIAGAGYRGFKSDMWSAGVCLYVMLVGTVPFRATTMEQLHKVIMTGRYGLQGEVISDSARDLMRKLIEIDPKKRLSASQCLRHPWLLSSDEGEPIDIGRADLADIIFTDKEKSTI